MSNQLPSNDEELFRQLMAAEQAKANKFSKIKCSFCGVKFYPTEHLPKYCTYTCQIMSAEIKGAAVSQEAYKAVKKFDEKAIEWQKSMAIMEEEYNKQQKELREMQEKALKKLGQNPTEEIEPKKSPKKIMFFNLGGDRIK